MVLTAGTVTDAYGSESLTWDAPTEVGVTTLAPAEPRPSGEPLQDSRNAVTSGWTLYLPEATVVGPRNRVRVRGKVYAVLGEPAAWTRGGLVVQAEVVTG